MLCQKFAIPICLINTSNLRCVRLLSASWSKHIIDNCAFLSKELGTVAFLICLANSSFCLSDLFKQYEQLMLCQTVICKLVQAQYW